MQGSDPCWNRALARRATLATGALLLAACGADAPGEAISPGASRAGAGPSGTEQPLEPDAAHARVNVNPGEASPAALSPARSTFRGRVIDGRGEEVLPAGFALRLAHRGRTVAEATSGPDGRFELELEAGIPRAQLFVLPPRGWRVPPTVQGHYFLLSPAELDSEAEFLVPALRERIDRLRGRAVSARTGEPLPFYRFLVTPERPPRARERRRAPLSVTCDAEGRFVSAETLPEGRILVRPDDGPSYGTKLQRVEFEHGPPEEGGLELAFRVGPRYGLALDGEPVPDASELTAWLVRVADGSVLGTARVSLEGGRPWVRFGELAAHLSPATELALALGHAESALFGEAPVRPSSEAEVTIELAPTGSLEVLVERDPPLAEIDERRRSRLLIEVQAVEGKLDGPSAAFRLARREFLPPGEYRVSALTRLEREASAFASVAARERTRVELTLERAGALRRVHGMVRAPSALEHAWAGLELRLAADPRRSWSVSLLSGVLCGGLDVWGIFEPEGEEQVARFTLESVPAGELLVEPRYTMAPFALRVDEEPSGDVHIEMHLLGELEPPGYGFLVRSVGSDEGERDPIYQVHTRAHDGGPALHRYGRNGRLIAAGDPRARRLEWAVVATGARTVFGTERDFEPGSDARSFARILLEPGYAVRILARDPAGAPLAGVEVMADGELAGRTDARGELELRSDHAPGRFEFRRGDWRLIAGELHPTFVLTPASAWHEVALGP